eukprot:362330_1
MISGCPNEQFKFISNYKKGFKLDPGKLYYIAIGSKDTGKWGIGFVSPQKSTDQFYCHRDGIGVGAPYQREKKWKGLVKKRVTPIMCCYAAADNLDERFDILPHAIINPLKTKVSADDGPAAPAGVLSDASDYVAYFYWFQQHKIIPNNRYLSLIMTRPNPRTRVPKSYEAWITEEECPWCVLYASSLKLDQKYTVEENSEFKCESPQKVDCDTGIAGDIVGFKYAARDGSTRISFAYSDDGIFNCNKLFPDMRKATRRYTPKVYYFPVSKWFDIAGEEQPKFATYGGWVLGSSCSACPTTSMKITITEAEAKMNKERFEHALSLGFSAGGGAGGAKLGGSIGYTYKSIKESATTLTSGRGTTITSVCNGFYIYYWAVTIGSWGGANADHVPTQRFYCTDWPKKPICLPRVDGMDQVPGDLQIACKGDDDDEDFCGKDPGDDVSKAAEKAKYIKCINLKPNKATQKWWSKHQGRPKPIRVVGQGSTHSQEKVLLTKGVTTAKYVDMGDILMHTYVNEKGLFDANVVLNDEETDKQYDGLQMSMIMFAVVGSFIGCVIYLSCCVGGGIVGYFVAQRIDSIGDKYGYGVR